MIEEIQVLSPWIEDSMGRRLKVGVDYPDPQTIRITDRTGTPDENLINDPNQCVCRVAGETAVIDAIIADVNYTMMEGTRQPYNG